MLITDILEKCTLLGLCDAYHETLRTVLPPRASGTVHFPTSTTDANVKNLGKDHLIILGFLIGRARDADTGAEIDSTDLRCIQSTEGFVPHADPAVSSIYSLEHRYLGRARTRWIFNVENKTARTVDWEITVYCLAATPDDYRKIVRLVRGSLAADVGAELGAEEKAELNRIIGGIVA